MMGPQNTGQFGHWPKARTKLTRYRYFAPFGPYLAITIRSLEQERNEATKKLQHAA
jgi:hypothetical protein